jgi:hypothetical protein
MIKDKNLMKIKNENLHKFINNKVSKDPTKHKASENKQDKVEN